MPLFVALGTFTDEGVKTMKEQPKRMEEADKKIAAAGMKITRYFTLGQYEVVAVIEAPSDEAAMKTAVAVTGQGFVRLQTMRAFSQAEFLKMI